MGYWDFYPRYPKSRPRAAKGGIKAQTKGAFGKSWWAKRWIAVLESFNIGGRLQRGRSYARNGQVLSIDVAEGRVAAKVQGSQAQPYKVTIGVKVLGPREWKTLIEALSSQARFVAKLLAGEMPQDIEEVFAKAKLSLFPEKQSDLKTACSCPDWSNPCKHVAAVYYLLGEEFDRDPFLLFRLRGLGREELLGRLNALTPAEAPASPEPIIEPVEQSEPLPSNPNQFWAPPGLADDLYGEVNAPPVSAAWLQRLGTFPFWRGGQSLLDALKPAYNGASKRSMDVFLGS